MARRRRRFKKLLVLLVLLLQVVAGAASHHFASNNNNHHHQLHHQHQHHHHHHLCQQLPSQVQRQLKLCKLMAKSPEADEAVAAGAARGLSECRHQFRTERWNCSHQTGDQQLLAGPMGQSAGNRESGFLQAIVAAGIVHSVAGACSAGNLSDCACDKTRMGLHRHQEEKWKWGGCSNNIRHGMQFAKQLVELLDAIHQASLWQQATGLRRKRQTRIGKTLPAYCQRNMSTAGHLRLVGSLLAEDSLERHHDFRLAMNMHNNKVGRMAVARNMEFRCRCHGLSGSCSMKTCWLSLPSFQVIGAYLKRKYERSLHLPTTVDVNRLLPMMDRQEAGAILANDERPPTLNGTPPEETEAEIRSPNATSEEIPVNNISPMSQQQYQALLRDMKLCNTSDEANPSAATATATATTTTLQRRHHTRNHHKFHNIGQQLKGASQQLQLVLQHQNKEELVHLHRSPDYCEPASRLGFAGLSGRPCSLEAGQAPDHCDKLCCGRGHTTRTYRHSSNCDCVFEFCCFIKCSVCEQEVRQTTCN